VARASPYLCLLCLAALGPYVSALAGHDDHKLFFHQDGDGTGNRAASQAVFLDKASLRRHGPSGYQLFAFNLPTEDGRELLREWHRAKWVDSGHARQLRGS
jgi:hypothetical protein